MSGVCNDCHSHPCVCGMDQAGAELSARLGRLLVPAVPEPARIESMCFRYNHGHGLQGFGETPEQFERRKEATRATMRQLYEEATGQGFYHDGWVAPV